MNKLIVCTALVLGLVALGQQSHAQVYAGGQIYQGTPGVQQYSPQQQYTQGQPQARPAPQQTQYYNVNLSEAEKSKPSIGASFYDTGRGVAVRSVYTNSPAQQAGINSGDLITKVNGQAVTTAASLNGMIAGVSEGSTIKLTKRSNSGKTDEVSCGVKTVGSILEASIVPEAGVFDTAVVQGQVNLKKMANDIKNAEVELADMKKRYASLQKQIEDLKAKAEVARKEEAARKAAAAKK
jgi:C-terminal processing protease CtpA/Prc